MAQINAKQTTGSYCRRSTRAIPLAMVVAKIQPTAMSR